MLFHQSLSAKPAAVSLPATCSHRKPGSRSSVRWMAVRQSKENGSHSRPSHRYASYALYREMSESAMPYPLKKYWRAVRTGTPGAIPFPETDSGKKPPARSRLWRSGSGQRSVLVFLHNKSSFTESMESCSGAINKSV